MPCRDDWGDESATLLHARTDMLCRTLTLVEQNSPCTIRQLPSDVQVWWTEHKQADEKRKAFEKEEQKLKEMRKILISGMTPEQRRALGVN